MVENDFTPDDYYFANTLIEWYEHNKRSLPWRDTQNPYYIWLSEVILQQTRVVQGLPYYLRFVEAFPTVTDLAQADQERVLRLWQGLGYYSRARNMHDSAKFIANQLGGVFPQRYQELLKLKGVGAYTAAAIASFAYNEDVAVVDGNVYRVLARFLGISDDIGSPKGQKFFAQVASELLKHGKSAVYNQAIMEFGALQCTPAKPNCQQCPLAPKCYAFAEKKQSVLPVKIKKIKAKNRELVYLVFSYQNQLLMKQRQDGDIWQGLYDFAAFEATQHTDNQPLFEQIVKVLPQPTEGLFGSEPTLLKLPNTALSLVAQGYSKTYKHTLTHQQLQVRFVHLSTQEMQTVELLQAVQPALRLFELSQITALPKPILIANYLQAYWGVPLMAQ